MQIKDFLLKFLFTILTFITALSVTAQDKFEMVKNYKPFKVDLGMGYARPEGNGSKAGVLLYIEPKYNLLNKLSVGLKTEATAMARGYVGIDGSAINGEAGLSLSFLATGDYYFTNHLVRPFIGGGAGIYNLVGVNATLAGGGSVQIPAVTKFGGMARAGIEIWHIRAGVEYNFIGKTNAISNNYLGLKIGIVLGGGKYNNDEDD